MKGHFYEVRPGTREMDWIGGEPALARIRAIMDELELELAPCPFCGARAELRSAFLYMEPAVLAVCTCCFCKTPPVCPQFDVQTGRNEPFSPDCAKRAADLWNRRTEATA